LSFLFVLENPLTFVIICKSQVIIIGEIAKHNLINWVENRCSYRLEVKLTLQQNNEKSKQTVLQAEFKLSIELVQQT